jgi:hypothetical protein
LPRSAQHRTISIVSNSLARVKVEMSDAIGTFMFPQRMQFAVTNVRRQPHGLAGSASLAGARFSRSLQAHDPGGGPGS